MTAVAGLAATLATTLAAATMVGATTTPARAAAPGTGTATFSCDVPLLGAVEVPLTLSPETLPTELLADSRLGRLPVAGQLELGGLLGLLGSLPLLGPVTQLGTSLTDFDLLLGARPVPVSGLGSQVGPPGPVAVLTGALGGAGVRAPARPGTYELRLPRAFELRALGLPAPLADLVPALSCTISDGRGPVVGTVTVTKQSPALSARVVRDTVRKGKPVKVRTKVTREDGKEATGKVVAVVGGKQVARRFLQNGRATLAIWRLGAGSKRVVVKYLGDSSTRTARRTVRVMVRR